jgi:adenine-specific DNA-methyltransferase
LNKALSLFNDITLSAPKTEGIKYAGSKLKLLPQILELAKKTGARTVLDGFSGTTRVAQALAKTGYRVFANDISNWSEVFAECYLLNRSPKQSYAALIDHLNAVPSIDGWFTEHYGGHASNGTSNHGGLKKPWQIHNTRKLDGIRQEIDSLSLSRLERAVAIASLILALDQVDSTLGHYVSYLKDWSPRSFKNLHLEVPNLFVSATDHEVYRKDVFDVADVAVDLAYFDPPYGSNNEKMPPSRVRYASYYHVWTTICLNDRPKLFGKAMRRKDTADVVAATVFEEFRRSSDTGQFLAVEAIERLIQKARAKWIILSYSSGGRATADELNDVLCRSGRIAEVVEMDHKKNVMAGMKWTKDWVRDVETPHREFLFLIEKN